jgi:hypothetical protein
MARKYKRGRAAESVSVRWVYHGIQEVILDDDKLQAAGTMAEIWSSPNVTDVY